MHYDPKREVFHRTTGIGLPPMLLHQRPPLPSQNAGSFINSTDNSASGNVIGNNGPRERSSGVLEIGNLSGISSQYQSASEILTQNQPLFREVSVQNLSSTTNKWSIIYLTPFLSPIQTHDSINHDKSNKWPLNNKWDYINHSYSP